MKILIDCGANNGQGFGKLTNMLNIDDTWKVVMYEPNVHCYNVLIGRNYGSYVTINQKAVFDENTQLHFKLSKTNNTSKCGTLHSEYYGAKSGAYKHEGGWREESTVVDCVDIVDVIEPLVGNEIYLKLDIEGSEYNVLERLIETKLIHNIKNLYVEFHDQYMEDSFLTNILERQNKIIDYIKNNTEIELYFWD